MEEARMATTQQGSAPSSSGAGESDLATAAENLRRSHADLQDWDEAAGRALSGDTTATPPTSTR